MSNPDSIVVKVPATTANLGAGFDCIGAALEFYNEFAFSLSQDDTTFTVEGEGADKITLDENNLLYQSFLYYYQQLNLTPPKVNISIKINVPLARGLGSSATAIIAGLLGANHFSSNSLTQTELLEMAIALEGHPDNVVPALLGNCILSVGEKGNWHFVPINCHEKIKFIVAIPDFELSTESARKVLPPHLTYSEAVYNIAHLGLLIKALETGNEDWLREALEDKLHQPYRKSLIKGYDEIYQAVVKGGGYGMVISGAGPTLLALTSEQHQETVTQAMAQTWASLGVNAIVKCLNLNTQGAISE
ncbi:homoserine kinase [Cyanobacterium aponinum]|uniref:Homoserine kinase n=1 Tax=Cyanobacterium aponinum (strain PCC 10605) TaxID=755178 RepID=K9Z730_CYAAP|nr:homoserine kinase [Cyanobacterium aponinum]AFZ54375.1 homoserine kinase [Cyanobacterium aponinum PCC 10605]